MMKKLLQRWLAMALAVLMVMGTLPTTAWAARITDDEVSEQPVLDPKTDPVADTQGKHDDGDIPIDPVDPDGPPADLNAPITSITLTNRTVSELTGTIATGAGSGQDKVTVLILPRYVTTVGANLDTVSYESYDPSDFQQLFGNGYAAAAEDLKSFDGMPWWYLSVGDGTTALGDQVSVDWNGTVKNVKTGATLQENDNKTGIAFTKTALEEYVNSKQFYEPTSPDEGFTANQAINPGTDGLPFTVFMAGSNGFKSAVMRIKITTQPLKVEVLAKQAEINDEPAVGTLLTYVTVTNQTNLTMKDVAVRLTRARPWDMSESDETGDDYLHQEPMPAENFGTTVIEKTDDKSEELFYSDDTPGAAFELYVKDHYGMALVPDAAGTTDAEGSTLTIPELAGGKTYTFIIETKWDPNTYAYSFDMGDETASDLKDTWFNYTVWADYTAPMSPEAGVYASNASNRDTGGIHSIPGNTITPQVQLVDSLTGEPIVETAGNNVHTVETDYRDKYMSFTYDAGTQTYTANGEVEIGTPIIVDKITTIYTASSKAVIKIPMYTVTVHDSPFNAAQGKKGSYVWDDELKKSVSCSYYVGGKYVGLYANATGFASWSGNKGQLITNASTVKGTVKDGRLILSDKSAVEPPERGTYQYTVVEIGNENEVITANYNIVKFVTTFNGDDIVTDNSKWSTEHVHNLTIEGNGEIHTYQWDRDAEAGAGGYVPSSALTVQERGITGVTADVPWSVALASGHVYTVSINGVELEQTIDLSTGTLPVVEGTTDINYVFELAGVQPQIVGGNKDTTMLFVPGDSLHGQTVDENGDVTVPGVRPASGWPVYYYPVGTTLTPTLYGGDNDALESVTYPDESNDSKKTVTGPETPEGAPAGVTKLWSVAPFEVLGGESNP